jgi:spectrin alpha
MRLRHNLEQQIQARKQSGVTDDSLKEYMMMFRYFDKEKTGRLTHAHFKSCLQALGIDLPVADSDPEFQRILDRVDPNRDGFVSVQDYMAFLISYETENVQSITEIEQAFRALTHDGEKPYITRQEIAASLSPELTEYCVRHMKPYVNPANNFAIQDAYDYTEFTKRLFATA